MIRMSELSRIKGAHRLLVQTFERYKKFIDWFDLGAESATTTKGWFRRVYTSDINVLFVPLIEDMVEADRLLEIVIDSLELNSNEVWNG